MPETSDSTALEPARAEPPSPINRRDFVRASLGSGFAAAVLPVQAQTEIKTDTTGLAVGEVSIAVGEHRMAAYRAAPAGRAKAPVVLVVSEVFGVHAYIADVARRLAQRGYFALAPELFERQGDAGSYGEVAKLIAEVVSRTPDAQVMADLDATVQWASANGGDTRKLAVTGFCWGGRITWLYSAHSPLVKAGAAWYGRLVGASSATSPKHPVDLASSLHGPVLGLYGGEDGGIPLTTVNQMKDALAAAGAKGNKAAAASEFVVYRDAPHAFHADYRPSYRKEAAEDGFKRALAWFKAHGAA